MLPSSGLKRSHTLCAVLDYVRKRGENFILTWHKDIRPKGRTMCWDVSDVQNKAAVNLFPCHGMQGNQLWRYNPEQARALELRRP
ncbi:putative polypeptide N-acetylgalactosaminyltransferase 10 isoform X2 [Periplaneta americana]|uniref:putative polypeptide N-acetylgalactosaminyltransferase 10 isoform X2 n=1 Tax=Periplaneta americana TaxID=6978 RepID=UPI0037E85A1C